eukprot:3909831-Rhodomonas_salina.2
MALKRFVTARNYFVCLVPPVLLVPLLSSCLVSLPGLLARKQLHQRPKTADDQLLLFTYACTMRWLVLAWRVRLPHTATVRALFRSPPILRIQGRCIATVVSH